MDLPPKLWGTGLMFINQDVKGLTAPFVLRQSHQCYIFTNLETLRSPFRTLCLFYMTFGQISHEDSFSNRRNTGSTFCVLEPGYLQGNVSQQRIAQACSLIFSHGKIECLRICL